MKGILIYLMLGLILGFIIENIWDDEEEGESLNMTYRLYAVLLWPIIIIIAILKVLGEDDNDDIIGPGGASR